MLNTRIGLNKKIYITTDDRELVYKCMLNRQKSGEYAVSDSLMMRIALGMRIEERSEDRPLLPLNDRLREYQKEDVLRMAREKRILNANDMGLGKTAEAIEACRILGLKKILVVAPKSVLEHWREQFNEWYQGSAPTVVNYEYLLNAFNFEQVERVFWDCIIVDEAHRIKNRSAKRTLALKKLRSQFRFALTGTPILNTPDDLWSIYDWIDNGIVDDSYWRFASMFCSIIDTGFAQKPHGLTKDDKMREVMHELVRRTTIRKTKEEVLNDLPAKGIYTVNLEMSKKQKELYKDTVKLLFDKLPETMTIQNAAVHFLRLQQVTCNPEMYIENCENPKINYIVDLAQDNPDKKLAVFTRFTGTIDSLVKALDANGITHTEYTGKLNENDRIESKKNFVKGGVQVFIGTIGAAGTGLDGLQYVCDTAIFIDCDWSPSINEQAEDRLCRMGQNQKVSIYYLQFPHSIDTRVGKKLELKQSDIKEIFDEVSCI